MVQSYNPSKYLYKPVAHLDASSPLWSPTMENQAPEYSMAKGEIIKVFNNL